MGVYDFCGVSGFCGIDGRVSGLMADNEHSYADCILHHTEKDILAEVKSSDSCANIFCEIHMGVIPANADYALTLSLKVANASSSTTTSSDYALIIPSAFTITQSGWNEITDGITAKVRGEVNEETF